MTFVFPIACYFKTFEWRNSAIISPNEKLMCFAILAYGIIGGTVSAVYAFSALLKSS